MTAAPNAPSAGKERLCCNDRGRSDQDRRRRPKRADEFKLTLPFLPHPERPGSVCPLSRQARSAQFGPPEHCSGGGVGLLRRAQPRSHPMRSRLLIPRSLGRAGFGW
jgi:hypothetical protein